MPQLSDPDYASRTRIRESDLRKHLINELAADDKTLEQDDKDDPRFSMTAEEQVGDLTVSVGELSDVGEE